MINVHPMTQMELASHVSRDTTSSKEFVNSLPSTMLNPQILDVELGIGTNKYVSHVLKDGLSMPTKFALLLVISVLIMMLQAHVQLASRDMISLMEFVNSLHSTMLSHLILDAVHGIGITKYAWLALKDGSSIQTKFVPQ